MQPYNFRETRRRMDVKDGNEALLHCHLPEGQISRCCSTASPSELRAEGGRIELRRGLARLTIYKTVSTLNGLRPPQTQIVTQGFSPCQSRTGDRHGQCS
jgi:hypothetical protein